MDQDQDQHVVVTIRPSGKVNVEAMNFQGVGCTEATEQIEGVIQEDQDVAFFVLGASMSQSGPGRLISWLAGQASGSFPVPIVLVPQTLTHEEIDALA